MSKSRSIHKRRRPAFTLIELLIVIVAMIIIAGMVIPQFQDAIGDAREIALFPPMTGG